MGSFEGKVVLVTGGGSGIGLATALRFGTEGAVVVVADRSESGQAAADQIVAAGGSAAFLQVDVTISVEVEQMVAGAVDRFGALDVAFNNAGIAGRSSVPTGSIEEDEWDRIIATNLTSVWQCMRHELIWMAEHGGGSIVNTSSTAGVVASTNFGAAYTASKHGVIGLTKTAAKEYARRNIRVNAVCPAGVDTPLLQDAIAPETLAYIRAHPGSVTEPDNIADAVLWLASDQAAFVNGHALLVDGGYTA
jgi:NAD(P)-dependent dehydrogenase (short-subunit alcohol dehydrogenase family)